MNKEIKEVTVLDVFKRIGMWVCGLMLVLLVLCFAMNYTADKAEMSQESGTGVSIDLVNAAGQLTNKLVFDYNDPSSLDQGIVVKFSEEVQHYDLFCFDIRWSREGLRDVDICMEISDEVKYNLIDDFEMKYLVNRGKLNLTEAPVYPNWQTIAIEKPSLVVKNGVDESGEAVLVEFEIKGSKVIEYSFNNDSIGNITIS